MGRAAGVIVGAAMTVSVSACVGEVTDALSVTWTENEKLPAWGCAALSVPVEVFNVSHAGNDPPATDQV